MKGGIGAEELEQDEVNLGSVVEDQDFGSDRCNLTQQEYTPHDMNHINDSVLAPTEQAKSPSMLKVLLTGN